jgi:hypothetical protein
MESGILTYVLELRGVGAFDFCQGLVLLDDAGSDEGVHLSMVGALAFCLLSFGQGRNVVQSTVVKEKG